MCYDVPEMYIKYRVGGERRCKVKVEDRRVEKERGEQRGEEEQRFSRGQPP